MKICFLSSTRYCFPLDRTSEKKFQAVKSLGDLFVIGFSPDLSPRKFSEHAHFYLLPKLPVAVMRYAEMFLLGSALAFWLVIRHKVQVLIAQSPHEGFAGALAKTVAVWLGYKVVLVVESHGDFEESLFLQRRVLLPGFYQQLRRGGLTGPEHHLTCGVMLFPQIAHPIPFGHHHQRPAVAADRGLETAHHGGNRL